LHRQNGTLSCVRFKTMKGIIYTRVSSDEQVKGTSLEFQEDLCRQYCARQSIEVVALFREEGESAKDLSLNNRQEFLKALEFCRKHKHDIQAFLVLRVDRFARNTEDHFAVRKILLEYGTTLYSVTEPIGNKPAEKFVETVLAGAAEYDNAIRKQRCSDGMSQKINQGLYPWKPPVGYVCNHFKKRGEKKTAPDPPDERIFPIIQKGLKYYAQSLCSQAKLVKLLDEWGLKSLRGKRTTPQLVDRLLNKYLNFYAGILVNPWTGDEKEGLHQPMITKEELQQIRLLKLGKSVRSVKHEKSNPLFPLRRTAVCASCNKFLTGSSSRGLGGKYSYYHCSNKLCSAYGKSISKQVIENDFLNYLKRITPKEKYLKSFKEAVLEVWKEKGRSLALDGKRHEKRVREFELKRKRIFEMREEGSYSKEEFLERKQEVENEITATKISLSESRIDGLDLEGAIKYAENFIRMLDRQWLDLSPHLRHQFQKLVFPEGIPYDKKKGIGTPKLGCIFELNQLSDDSKSPVVDLVRLNWNKIIEELKEIQKLTTPSDPNIVSVLENRSQVKWGKVA
jgi:site-specific DNA recombinase